MDRNGHHWWLRKQINWVSCKWNGIIGLDCYCSSSVCLLMLLWCYGLWMSIFWTEQVYVMPLFPRKDRVPNTRDYHHGLLPFMGPAIWHSLWPCGHSVFVEQINGLSYSMCLRISNLWADYDCTCYNCVGVPWYILYKEYMYAVSAWSERVPYRRAHKGQ